MASDHPDSPSTTPAITVRRLAPGDEAVLSLLARDEADFGLDDGGGPSIPLDGESAAAFLADPAVLHWVATSGDLVVGHLLCLLERRRAWPPRQLLLYDIGVREDWRERGVGRAMVDEMTAWMRMEEIDEVWVVADAGAVPFYDAMGFATTDGDLVFMERTVLR